MLIKDRLQRYRQEDYHYFDRLPKGVRQAIANHCDQAPARLVHSWYMNFGENKCLEILYNWRWPRK